MADVFCTVAVTFDCTFGTPADTTISLIKLVINNTGLIGAVKLCASSPVIICKPVQTTGP